MKILKSQLKEIIREVLEEANWIKGAIKKPGALRKSMGVKKGEKIPMEKINKKIATLSKKGEGDKKLTKPERTELARLNLAKTLRKMKK
jgi:hypothetical protein|tara:strand:- start:1952 stop:2218 length:267 start_codon:yes stop_codon:yes gene_type:complete